MKKTLITLSIAASMAVATASADLVYSDDFTDENDNGYITTYALTNQDANVIDVSEYGLNVTDGFTISISSMNTSDASEWAHILGLSFDGSTTNMNSDGKYCFITWQDGYTADGQGTVNSTSSAAYNGPVETYTLGVNPAVFDSSAIFAGTGTGTGELEIDTWYNIILTVQNDAWTISIYDINGLIDTVNGELTSVDLTESVLTDLYIGGTNAGSTDNSTNNKSTIQVDCLAVYDTVLTTEEQETLANTSLSTGLISVPEPSTATLSLLALAGLCARRRRK